MSTPTINTKVKLDGEKEYKKALSEINGAMRSLRSDMQLLSEEFDGNGESVAALRAVNEKLNEQILTQKEKVDTLRAALEDSAATYGEASTKTTGWRTSLNSAETELLKLEKALRENTQALEDAGGEADNFSGGLEDLERRTSQWADSVEDAGDDLDDFKKDADDAEESTGSLGDALGKLADSFGIQLPDGVAKGLDKLDDVDPKLIGLVGGFAAVVTAIVKVEKALADMTLEAAESAASIQNLSQTVGMSTASAQKWDYVLKTVGSSLEDAQGDLSALQEKMRDAVESGGDVLDVFNTLGVTLQDESGTLRSTEEVLYDVVTALQEMEDATNRNAISSDLLGGTGEKLIPIYNKTSEELDALMQRKEELGILNEEEIETLTRVKGAQLEANEAIESGKNAIAERFAPALENFLTRGGEAVGELEKALADSGLIEVFGSILDLVVALTPALDLFAKELELCRPIFDTASAVIGGIATALDAVFTSFEALIQLISGDKAGAAETISGIPGILSGSTAVSTFTGAGGGSTSSAVLGYAMQEQLDAAEELKRNTVLRAAARKSAGLMVAPFSHTVGKFASGSDFFPGGRTLLSENGPEMAILPQGTRIMTAQETREATGGDTYYVAIEARTVKEIEDIARMAKEKRRTERMRGAD